MSVKSPPLLSITYCNLNSVSISRIFLKNTKIRPLMCINCIYLIADFVGVSLTNGLGCEKEAVVFGHFCFLKKNFL